MYGCKTFVLGKELFFEITFKIIKKNLFVVCGKLPCSRKNLGLWKNLCLWKRSWWRKSLGLWKTSLIKEKPLLVENILEGGKIFACGKLHRWKKNLYLWKTTSIKKIYIFFEIFLDEEKVFACGELSQWRKSLCLSKTCLIVEK